MQEERLPTALWVEAHLRRLNADGRNYYITQTGNYASGVVLVKISALDGTCRLLIQQRDLDGNLGWTAAMKQETVEEKTADEYIARATSRDPDLWVIEIEDREKNNPFEGSVF